MKNQSAANKTVLKGYARLFIEYEIEVNLAGVPNILYNDE